MQLPEPGRRGQPCGDQGLALGCRPHPLETPPVVLSWMFASLARFLGNCLIPRRPTDVHSWRRGSGWNPVLPGAGLGQGAGNLGPDPRLHLYLVVWPWVGLWPPGASVSSLSHGGDSSFFHHMLTEDPRCARLCVEPRAQARPSGPCLQVVYAPWRADMEHL